MASKKSEANEINSTLPSTELKHLPDVDRSTKFSVDVVHLEDRGSHTDSLGNIVYTNEEEEPELRLRTWIALVSIYLLLAGQGLAFQGPPAVVSASPTDNSLERQNC
jgi:hypothetical protein